jgi:hypothetical protein
MTSAAGVSLRIDTATVRKLEEVIDTSGLGPWFETELRAVTGRLGGRRRVLTARALLVGLLALSVAEQPLILRDVVRLLNALHPSAKHRLGIPRAGVAGEGAVTERQVSYLVNRLTALLDPSPHSAANRGPYEAARDAVLAAHADGDGALPDPDAAQEAEAAGALAAALEQVKADHQQMLDGRHARLRWVLDRGLDATLPAETEHTGSYALDGSELRTWARQNRAAPKRPWLHPDPDAAWNGKKSWSQAGRTNGWFGYWLHGLVRVPEAGSDAADVPCLVERIDITPANADARVAGLGMLTRMVADHEATDAAAGRANRPRRDVLADRAYTSESRRADDWIWPLWEHGFTSVHELTENQLGPAGRATPRPRSGALVVDGQPYSPRLPAHLRSIDPPKLGATRADIAAYQALIAQRKLYALHAVGGRNTDGSWDFGCRAMALLGQLRCDLKPDSLQLPHNRPTTAPGVFTPANGRLPKVCGQQKARVQRDELPYWQPDLYGSTEWYASYNRRNRIEGIFGNLKNDATQDITRGSVRVMGLAKTAFLTMVAVMAVNLRLLDRWRARQASKDDYAPAPVRRRPRRRTRLLADTRARIAAAQAQAAAIAGHDPAPPPQE